MKLKTLTISICTATMLLGSSSSLSFKEVPVPMTDNQKRSILATSKITLDGKSTNIAFHTIARSGDVIGSGTFGMIYDMNGNVITNDDGTPKISNKADFSSLLLFDKTLFMVSQFETIPAALYLTKLKQDSTGHLSAVSTKNIDVSSVDGLWIPCAGTVTPWNTHLGSEEYEPNADKLKPDTKLMEDYLSMAKYFSGDLNDVNPYSYGWTPEVIVLNENGDTKVVKHYAMGRFSHELSYVMPDKKTVYLSDDGTNVGLFMFIADKAGDLSSGNLYAAKWKQTSSHSAGKADIEWISLGHSTNEYISKTIKQKITFSDIFDSSTTLKDGFTSINTRHGQEFLKVKLGMEEVASRLETRRYAAIQGATTEFRKMEGVTFDEKNKTIYLSMSMIGKGMADNHTTYDKGGHNDIKLSGNPCGAIYALKVDSNFIAHSMYSAIEGSLSNELPDNKCSVLGIANPDNLTFIQNRDTLIVSEDTKKGHQNDYIWAYNVDSEKLTRIQTTPYGSETTGTYIYNNIGGYGYMTSVVQHPFGDEDSSKRVNSKSDFKSYTGYLGPLPVVNK